jgi:hypothetical protein
MFPVMYGPYQSQSKRKQNKTRGNNKKFQKKRILSVKSQFFILNTNILTIFCCCFSLILLFVVILEPQMDAKAF